uniref:Sushi domain-containing protein n=1 Tax=Cavia porcellus TaxID=10141 RepID=A0A286XL21_CAVPO
VDNAIMVSENKSLFSLHEIVEFRCQPGFIMSGPTTVQCQAQNKWGPGLPNCSTGVKCSLPNEFMSEVLEEFKMREYHYGDNITLQCKDGYTLDGRPWSHCQADGRWAPPLPSCTPRPQHVLIFGISCGVIIILAVFVSCWIFLKLRT